MTSPLNVLWIGNNSIANVGRARIGVGGSNPGPPTTVRLGIVAPSGTEYRQTVTLGETFSVGDETWRFADIDFESADQYSVCLRRVDADEPQDQPSGRIWPTLRLQPYGSLDDSQVAALESQLGQSLPGVTGNGCSKPTALSPPRSTRSEACRSRLPLSGRCSACTRSSRRSTW